MIETIPCLEEEKCLFYKQKVESLKPFWSQRFHGNAHFHTLGTCSYLDAPHRFDLYEKSLQKTNPILKTHFEELYKHVFVVLEDILKKPVELCHKMAHPGFHIFHKATHSLPTMHFDGQFTYLKWPYQNVSRDDVFSFTLPLELPKEGGGLNVWPIHCDQFAKLSAQEKILMLNKKSYHPYQLGRLVFHQGLILHQIAHHQTLEENDMRLTLQGHGILADGKYRIYW